MKRRSFLLGVAAVIAAPAAGAALRCDGPACTGPLVLVGTRGTGIYAARLDPATGALTALGPVAEVDRPTWLLADPGRQVVYAVSETGSPGGTPGAVVRFKVDRSTGHMVETGRAGSGGAGPTHLALDRSGAALFAANYGSGSVAAIGIGRTGAFTASTVETHAGNGPSPRQKSPHAHGVTLSPDGRFLLSPDLGADRVFVYRWDGRSLSPASVPWVAFPPGSGPRHLAFSRDGRFAFVVTELSGEIFDFRWDRRAGTLAPVSQVRFPAGPDPSRPASGSELVLSPDGRFLVAGDRAADMLHVLSVDRRTGALTATQSIPAGGKAPWSFAFDPTGRWLVVADQASDNLAVFAFDAARGALSATGSRLAVPHPSSVAFVE